MGSPEKEAASAGKARSGQKYNSTSTILYNGSPEGKSKEAKPNGAASSAATGLLADLLDIVDHPDAVPVEITSTKKRTVPQQGHSR